MKKVFEIIGAILSVAILIALCVFAAVAKHTYVTLFGTFIVSVQGLISFGAVVLILIISIIVGLVKTIRRR